METHLQHVLSIPKSVSGLTAFRSQLAQLASHPAPHPAWPHPLQNGSPGLATSVKMMPMGHQNLELTSARYGLDRRLTIEMLRTYWSDHIWSSEYPWAQWMSWFRLRWPCSKIVIICVYRLLQVMRRLCSFSLFGFESQTRCQTLTC